MEDFTGSVSTAGTTADRAFDARGLDDELEDLRRSLLAQQRSLYALEERCRPLEPTVVDFRAPPPDFDEVCRIAPKRLDPATAQLADASITLPEGDPRVEAANARRLMRGLEDYAEALESILTADTRSKTAGAAASALDALGDLFEAGGDRGDRPGITTREGQGLVARVTDEVLETYRYRQLRRVVTEADPAVQEAARIVAVWYNREIDRGRVGAAYAALETAIDEAVPGDPAGLARVEAAYETARRTEEAAGWRVFWNIGVAHAAIAKSLGRPGNMDALKDANTRIFDLADSVKAFAERD